MSDVVYLYGFVPADGTLDGVPAGIDDHAVEAVSVGRVRAVVSRLPAAAYAADAIEAHLQDLDWVAARGLAHERVVAWFVDHGEIVPAPLFTLFSSTDALASDAASRAGELEQTLDRFTGLREWDVKVAYRADVVAQHADEVSDAVRSLDAEIAAATPGRRFLLERKRADVLKREVSAAAHRIADETFDALQSLAREAVRLTLPNSDDLPVVLSAAALVERDAESRIIDSLTARADALRPLGIELTFSGPWAAYRFMGARHDD